MTPSKSPYSMGWSSTFTASRLSFMSYDGPLGTAHDRSTPPISRRRSKCKLRAACLWTTNRRPGTVETAPVGSGEVSGERFARYWERLSSGTVKKYGLDLRPVSLRGPCGQIVENFVRYNDLRLCVSMVKVL